LYFSDNALKMVPSHIRLPCCLSDCSAVLVQNQLHIIGGRGIDKAMKTLHISMDIRHIIPPSVWREVDLDGFNSIETDFQDGPDEMRIEEKSSYTEPIPHLTRQQNLPTITPIIQLNMSHPKTNNDFNTDEYFISLIRNGCVNFDLIPFVPETTHFLLLLVEWCLCVSLFVSIKIGSDRCQK